MALTVSAAQAAHAASVSVFPSDRGRWLTYEADPGEASRLRIQIDEGANATLVDTAATIDIDAGCRRVDVVTVTCARIDGATVLLADRDDALEFQNASVNRVWLEGFGGDGADAFTCDRCEGHFLGLGGDDVLTSGGDIVLYGGPGDDTLRGTGLGRQLLVGERGNDVLSGGGGVDVIRPGTGVDSVDGGSGRDILSYVGGGAVRVDLRAGVATGAGRDTLNAVEDVYGSFYADVLVGDAGANRIDARGGRDVVRGGAGADILRGESDESESLESEAASDTVYGGAGDDRLAGVAGNDVLVGGEGRDYIAGGAGDDVLRADDGAHDRVLGGRGLDRARVDRGLDAVRAVECVYGRHAASARACRAELAG